ncbi:MAG: hypothetical protein J6K97_03385 [Clostridia bacterium]|nr:hypothetical protein [Clostridia bacterium]
MVAPTGYPDTMLDRKTNEETGGQLNIFLQGFAKIFENFSVKPRVFKSFVSKIKGKTLGNTFNAQAEIPLKVCFIYISGKIIMFIIK